MTLADEIAYDTQRIRALSRTRPHVFVEDKDAIARHLLRLASEVRTTFGGTPPHVVPGIRVIGGQDVRVERRRA